mmetsp:Transcript_23151/g.64233  ORF Transcript_23151/g.64233 Transcript_23151/m.64233 type:complete len:308 (+) Transcript_23151:150-1073(+)
MLYLRPSSCWMPSGVGCSRGESSSRTSGMPSGAVSVVSGAASAAPGATHVEGVTRVSGMAVDISSDSAFDGSSGPHVSGGSSSSASCALCALKKASSVSKPSALSLFLQSQLRLAQRVAQKVEVFDDVFDDARRDPSVDSVSRDADLDVGARVDPVSSDIVFPNCDNAAGPGCAGLSCRSPPWAAFTSICSVRVPGPPAPQRFRQRQQEARHAAASSGHAARPPSASGKAQAPPPCRALALSAAFAASTAASSSVGGLVMSCISDIGSAWALMLQVCLVTFALHGIMATLSLSLACRHKSGESTCQI